jgi:hypothetical protein
MKITLDSIKKNKREIYFSLAGSLLALVLIYVFVSTIGFLVTSVEAGLSVKSSSANITHFNLGALKTLGITSSNASTSGTSTP